MLVKSCRFFDNLYHLAVSVVLLMYDPLCLKYQATPHSPHVMILVNSVVC